MNIDKIVAAIPSQSVDGRATTRANALRWLEKGTDPQKAAAVQLLAALDAHQAAERDALSTRLSGLPVARRVVEAFTTKPMTENERNVIQALLDNPGSTTTELSRACGFGENMIWQMHFGNLCKDRQTYLWPAETAEKRGAPFFGGILAGVEEPSNRFTMKPEVIPAFAAMGLRARPAAP